MLFNCTPLSVHLGGNRRSAFKTARALDKKICLDLQFLTEWPQIQLELWISQRLVPIVAK